jgi:hypothetical protein
MPLHQPAGAAAVPLGAVQEVVGGVRGVRVRLRQGAPEAAAEEALRCGAW